MCTWLIFLPWIGVSGSEKRETRRTPRSSRRSVTLAKLSEVLTHEEKCRREQTTRESEGREAGETRCDSE